MEKTDNDGLINIFMGLPDEVDEVLFTGATRKKKHRPLKYSKSWDALMPVVERIRELKPRNDFFVGISILHATIDRVYPRVIEFINWYNNNNKAS